MKLYTKKGDDGRTELFGAKRVEKDSLRIEAIGCIDELNAHLGLARCETNHSLLSGILAMVQNRLFELGAELASPGTTAQITEGQIDEIERHIDGISEELCPLKTFILPGGTELATRLHVARSVCRRAERRCIALGKSESVGGAAIIFLNRLSDLLFALARQANQLGGANDIPWPPQTKH